jgi:hypothetical protein
VLSINDNADIDLNARFCYSNSMEQRHIDRFWNQVDKTNSCWIWTGSVDKGNYGRFSVNSREISAHRFSKLIAGQDPTGFMVCHRCHNTRCVNPDHLYLGTAQDNQRDKVESGRSHFKFDLNTIQEIKDKMPLYRRRIGVLAKEYGIDRCHLYRAIKYLERTK